MITIPIGFYSTSASPGPTPYSPPTNGMLLWVDADVSSCYPGGTGSIVYDLSPNGLTGSIQNTSYSNTSGFQFSNVNTSRILFEQSIFEGSRSTFSYVFWLKPLSTATAYYADPSRINYDIVSLVYGYNGQAVRPWYGGTYNGMDPVGTPINTSTMVAFCKDSNALSNNYKSYKNGVLQQTVTASFTRTWNNGFIFNVTSLEPGNWVLWRALIYDRALTEQEVNDMYTYMSLQG